MTFWTAVEDYQTLIVGTLGFTGVIITLLVNAWLARRQRRDEQRHERQTLRIALIEELKINRDAVDRNMEPPAEDSKPKGAFVPTDPMDDAYRAFTDRIGLLSRDEVSKIMFAYLSLRTYNAKLFLIGVPPHTGDRHVNVPAKNIEMLVQLLESLIGPVDKAIEVMESARDAEQNRDTRDTVKKAENRAPERRGIRDTRDTGKRGGNRTTRTP